MEKDPISLWRRYVDWLYQHKELGLLLDVSRIGFTDEFLDRMEPKFQKAFRDMQDLERGSIANPDEGRMVGHYWLRNPRSAPKPLLTMQIENTLEAICKFADDVIGGKVRSCLISFFPHFSFIFFLFDSRNCCEIEWILLVFSPWKAWKLMFLTRNQLNCY